MIRPRARSNLSLEARTADSQDLVHGLCRQPGIDKNIDHRVNPFWGNSTLRQQLRRSTQNLNFHLEFTNAFTSPDQLDILLRRNPGDLTAINLILEHPTPQRRSTHLQITGSAIDQAIEWLVG